MRRRISPLVPQDLQKAVPERASTEHKLLTDSPSPSPGDPLGEGVAPRVKAAVTDKILQEGRRPCYVARSLGELGRGPGKKARAARGHSMGLTEQLLDWPKSSSGFSVTAHGKIQTNFLANPMFISSYGRILCY